MRPSSTAKSACRSRFMPGSNKVPLRIKTSYTVDVLLRIGDGMDFPFPGSFLPLLLQSGGRRSPVTDEASRADAACKSIDSLKWRATS